MRKFKKTQLARMAAVLCVTAALALAVAVTCSAANLNIISFGRRDATTSDAPPIGSGLESGANDIIDGIESGADDIIDGIESGAEDIIDGADSAFDGVESDMNDGMGDGMGDGTDDGMGDGFDTNIPDFDIGGAVEDEDSDGLSDPTDPDDDNDGTPDASDTDADNDGISDKNDPDPDGDGVDESKTSGLVIGIVIAVLAVGAIGILIYALMPKKPPHNKH